MFNSYAREKVLTQIRTASLGSRPSPEIPQTPRILVHRLDLHRRPDSAHGLRGLRCRLAIPSLDYAKQFGFVCTGTVAGDVVLLACTDVFCGSEYMGQQSAAAHESCFRYTPFLYRNFSYNIS